MKCVIPEISWHNREPVLCIDIHPINKENVYKIATGGADYHILIWIGTADEKGSVSLQVACDLTRHQKAVNSVRWAPDGSMLASADDDGIIFIWGQKIDPNDLKKENYVILKTLRGHKEDIYDLCWSPKCDKIFSGSIDNTAILWDVLKGKCEHIFGDHKGFVQGVCFDPQGQYVATLSSDRYCRIIDVNTKQVKSRIIKGYLPVNESNPFYNKEIKYFHDDTFKSYFRRFGFSPDGNLFITPSGLIETDENTKSIKCAYLFTLDNPQPVGFFPFDNLSTLVAKFSPILYKLSETESKQPFVNLPYRMVFAIAAETDVFLYDTQQTWPFGRLKNVHYTRITDLSWSSDGKLLVASSSDGFCTLLSFSSGEIGEIYKKEVETEEEKENSGLNMSGVEELDSEEPVKKIDESEKERKSFLLQWAHQGDKKEEKINVLTVRKAPRIPSNENKNEVIEIKDDDLEDKKLKKAVGNLNISAELKKENKKRQKQQITPNKTKNNPLLKFLTSPDKKLKLLLEDNVARDAWHCEGDKKIIKPPQNETKTNDEEEIPEEVTVPDLDLRLERSNQPENNQSIVLSDDEEEKVITILEPPVLKHRKTLNNISEDVEGKAIKGPRRVALITLSSPKQKDKKIKK